MANQSHHAGIVTNSAINPAVKIIDDALDKTKPDDIKPMYAPHVIEALATLYKHDEPEWLNYYVKLRPFRIATSIRDKVKLFLKNENKLKKTAQPASSALPTLSGNFSQHQDSTSQHRITIVEGFLILPDYDRGDDSLVIESKAAVEIARLLDGVLSYCVDAQSWHEFTGTYWRVLESTQFADRRILEIVYIGTEPIGFKSAYKNNIKALIADGNMLPLPKANHRLIPFTNGLLNLETSILEPITPRNAQLWCLPYAHNTKADCKNIKAWLATAVDSDKGTVQFLRAWLAALLHGRSDLQKFLHLKGSGGTGKGTFFRLATAMLGSHNVISTTLEQLETNRFETARLYGKRLAAITDSGKFGGAINTLKAITGQDNVRLERKHQQQHGDFIFGGLVMMASNESLKTTDYTSGLDRRRLTVIFNRRATDEEKRHWQSLGGEEQVLHSELPGLVNWLLELSQDEISRLIRNPPERVNNANLDAMQAGNPIAEWFHDSCEVDVNYEVQIGDKREIKCNNVETVYIHEDERLYPNYLRWCNRNHKKPLALNSFREILLDTLNTLKVNATYLRNKKGRFIRGIRLMDDQKLNRDVFKSN